MSVPLGFIKETPLCVDSDKTDIIIGCDECTPMYNFVHMLPEQDKESLIPIFDKNQGNSFLKNTCQEISQKKKQSFLSECKKSDFKNVLCNHREVPCEDFCESMYDLVVKSCTYACDDMFKTEIRSCSENCPPESQEPDCVRCTVLHESLSDMDQVLESFTCNIEGKCTQ